MTSPLPHDPEDPVVLAFVVCHKIFRDPRTGSCTLIGVSLRIRPLIDPETGGNGIGVYALLTNMRGRYWIQFHLLSAEDERRLGEASIPAESAFEDPLDDHALAVNTLPQSVPPPGRYIMRLLSNGRHLRDLVFWVEPWDGNEDRPGAPR